MVSTGCRVRAGVFRRRTADIEIGDFQIRAARYGSYGEREVSLLSICGRQNRDWQTTTGRFIRKMQGRRYTIGRIAIRGNVWRVGEILNAWRNRRCVGRSPESLSVTSKLRSPKKSVAVLISIIMPPANVDAAPLWHPKRLWAGNDVPDDHRNRRIDIFVGIAQTAGQLWQGQQNCAFLPSVTVVLSSRNDRHRCSVIHDVIDLCRVAWIIQWSVSWRSP